jgi:hypothetical protein
MVMVLQTYHGAFSHPGWAVNLGQKMDEVNFLSGM